MRLECSISKPDYIKALRRRMGWVSDFGRQRFTGAFLGNFFYITHHSPWEWNRKITGEKCSALGFVTATENGCRVRYLKFIGASDPKSWIKFFLLFYIIFSLKGWDWSHPISWPLILIGTALCAVSSLLACLFTENGQLGAFRLTNLLKDPLSFEKE